MLLKAGPDSLGRAKGVAAFLFARIITKKLRQQVLQHAKDTSDGQ